MSSGNSTGSGFFSHLIQILTAKPKLPVSLEENSFLKLILQRRSVRKFTNKKISQEIIEAILEAGRLAPSSANLQTWTFIYFNPSDWQNKFAKPMPFSGQLAIIVLSDLLRLKIVMEDYKFPNKPLVLHTIAVFNAGLAAMNMTLAAEACGLSSIMLSETGQTGLMDVGYLKETLSLPENVIPITTIVFGYPRVIIKAIPPRLPISAISAKARYPHMDPEVLSVWLAQMEAGYKAMRPWTSFQDQIEVYQKKIEQAEEDMKEEIF